MQRRGRFEASLTGRPYYLGPLLLGPGPKTALKVGALVGFASGFPTNFGTATWAVIPRIFPLGWMLELWVGAILATLVAGRIYRDREG